MPGKQINFYTRPGCHLCEDALKVLQDLQREFKFSLTIVDINDSEDLVARYGNDIPVAELDGRRNFKHRTERRVLHRLLSRLLAQGFVQE